MCATPDDCPPRRAGSAGDRTRGQLIPSLSTCRDTSSVMRPSSEESRIITTLKKSQCRIAAQMIVRMVLADLGGLVGEMMFFVARGSGRCSQDIFGGHLS